MKNKLFTNAFFTCSLFFMLFSTGLAQSSSIGFKSGIRIATKTEAIFEDSNTRSIRPLDKWETVNGKDILHRRLIDTKNGIFFGYDVEVSRAAEPNKFNVAIKPLSYKSGSNSEAEKAEFEKYIAAPLPKFPAGSIVENGDIIKLELLENPEKKIKIVDYLKVYDVTKPYADSFSELTETRDFSLDEVNLKLMSFQVFTNGKLVAQMGGGGSGPNIGFTVPEKGRFLLSAFPRQGYNFQKIGVIVDNKLTFTINNEKYEVISSSPILAEGGNWNVWVLADPNYKKSMPNPKNPDSIEFSAGNIDGLFKKFELNNK